MSSTYDFPGGTDSECEAMLNKPACHLCRGAGLVTYRDGIAYETHDVEKEEHLIEDCPECKGSGLVLPGHDETMANLNALTIRTCEHEWRDVDSQSDNAVKCTKCKMPGERQRDGSVYWPAT